MPLFGIELPFGRTRGDQAKVLRWEQDGDVLIVQPCGDSLRVEEAQLGAEIDRVHDLVDGGTVRHAVIDLGAVTFFGTVVIGALMTICHKVREKGGKVAWCNASPNMREVIQIMRLDTVMPYHATRTEALAAVRQG